MADKKVVVAGATGLVGNAALRHFGRIGGCDVVALSRRKPRELAPMISVECNSGRLKHRRYAPQLSRDSMKHKAI